MKKIQCHFSINGRLKEAFGYPKEPIGREQMKQLCLRIGPLAEEKSKRRRIPFLAFLKRQIRYTGWQIWFVQAAILLLLCFVFNGLLENLLEDGTRKAAFLLCCLSVFILLSSVPMLHRSVRYKMHEIELATRFSSVKLLLAKLLAIGIGDIFLLSAAFGLTITNTSLQAGSTLLYLLLPSLMAGGGFLYLLGHIPADRFEGCSAGLGGLMLSGFVLLRRFAPDFFGQTFSAGWMIVCFLLMLFILQQLRYIMYRSAYAEIY